MLALTIPQLDRSTCSTYSNDSLLILNTEPENSESCAVREPSTRMGHVLMYSAPPLHRPIDFNINPTRSSSSSLSIVKHQQNVLRTLHQSPNISPLRPALLRSGQKFTAHQWNHWTCCTDRTIALWNRGSVSTVCT